MKHICSALKRNGEKGFTLVELIVVIAILAILAAVAYPVYTGYITKANEAADLALLGHVNESFASALYDVGYYDGLPPEATFKLGTTTVKIGENGAVRLDAKKLPATGLTDSDALDAAFDKYYEGNEGSTFKVFETLIYDGTTGGFAGQYGDVTVLANGNKMEITDNKDGSHTYTVTGKDGKKISYTMQDDYLASYQNSHFGEMPVSDLMGDVNSIVDAMQSALMGGMINYNYKSLGIDENDYKNPDGSFNKEAADRAAANAAVLMVAKQTASGGFDASKYIDSFVKGTAYSSSIDNMWSQYALDIAMATSFANSEYGDQLIEINGQKKTVAQHYADQLAKLKELTGKGANMAEFNKEIYLFNIDKTPLFKEYYQKYGEKDLDAYLSTMSAITQNDQAVRDSGVLKNGWDDEDFGAILDAVFGGGNG